MGSLLPADKSLIRHEPERRPADASVADDYVGRAILCALRAV
jgi:hypothetical protein